LAAATKRFVDTTKHFVVVTKYFGYPYFNKWLCWYNKTFYSVLSRVLEVRQLTSVRLSLDFYRALKFAARAIQVWIHFIQSLTYRICDSQWKSLTSLVIAARELLLLSKPSRFHVFFTVIIKKVVFFKV